MFSTRVKESQPVYLPRPSDLPVCRSAFLTLACLPIRLPAFLSAWLATVRPPVRLPACKRKSAYRRIATQLQGPQTATM